MIYDRTQFDVDDAKRIRQEVIQKGISPTTSQEETLERGMITINALNRIEDKQSELKSLCNSMGYWDINLITKTWSYTDVFDETEFKRLMENAALLKKGFLTFATTPDTPTALYHFTNINNLEKILFDLGVMVDDITALYRECGNYQCGEG